MRHGLLGGTTSEKPYRDRANDRSEAKDETKVTELFKGFSIHVL